MTSTWPDSVSIDLRPIGAVAVDLRFEHSFPALPAAHAGNRRIGTGANERRIASHTMRSKGREVPDRASTRFVFPCPFRPMRRLGPGAKLSSAVR